MAWTTTPWTLPGNVALAISPEAEYVKVAFEGQLYIVAKVLVDCGKKIDAFELKGGYLDGKALDVAEVAKLATLPSLLELRGKIVGLIQAPATKLVRLLSEPGGQLARLVDARAKSLGE